MPDRRELWIFSLTVAAAAAVLVSIAGAETLLAIACLAWLLGGPRRMVWPGYIVPLCVFMAMTVVSVVASPQPAIGMAVVRKFVLFSMGLLATNFVRTTGRARVAHGTLLAVAALASTVAVVQFARAYLKFLSTQSLADDPTVLARITGFMGHWMTFSGEQLLVWCAAVPSMLFLGRRWSIPLAAVSAALILSFTRSVWLGAMAGFLVVVFMIPRRVSMGVVLPVAFVAAIASGLIYHRVAMSFGPKFAPDLSRIEMLSAGFRMIQEHPLFGIGPERVHAEFPRYYHGNDLTNFYYGHLHNNIVQIAAERGLVCLAAFLWFIFALYADLLSMLKRAAEDAQWIVLSALAALTGFVVAGFFEYNFGDSEVLLLLLFIVSIPYGAALRVEADDEYGTRLQSKVDVHRLPV